MLIKLIYLLSATFLFSSSAVLTNNHELLRQYKDFRKIFNKEKELDNGFENFVQNLNRIEMYNNEHNGCKMYLNRYSDENGDESVYNVCV